MFVGCDDVPDWPDSSLGQKLTALEESLFCPICQSHYDNPQILNCGHSFCSICIRKHFDKTLNRTTSDICPCCREKADTNYLKVNRVLSVVINNFNNLRNELHDHISVAASSSKRDVVEILDDGDCLDLNRKNRVKSRDSMTTLGTKTCAITQRMPHYNFHGVPRDKVKKTIEKLVENSRVKLRLDGDKDVLERRLREVVHLNNAQVNALHPLSFEQVVRHVNDRETAKEVEARKALRTAPKLDKLKKGEAVKELDDGFARLMEKAAELKRKARENANACLVADKGEVGATDNHSQESLLPSNPVVDDLQQGGVQRIGNLSMDAAAVTDLLERPYDWGPWRVVMSNKLGRPFFFNTATQIGQFAVPSELVMTIDGSEEDSQELMDESAGDVATQIDLNGLSATVGAAAIASLAEAAEVDLLFPYHDSQQGVNSQGKGSKRISQGITGLSGEVSDSVHAERDTERGTSLLPPPIQTQARHSCDTPSSQSSGTKKRGRAKVLSPSDGADDLFTHTNDEGIVDPLGAQLEGWACRSCTFLNSDVRHTCDICGAANTAAESIANNKPKRNVRQSQQISGSVGKITQQNSSAKKPRKS